MLIFVVPLLLPLAKGNIGSIINIIVRSENLPSCTQMNICVCVFLSRCGVCVCAVLRVYLINVCRDVGGLLLNLS